MIPPKPQAAKYFPLYSSIFGLGSVFSRADISEVAFFHFFVSIRSLTMGAGALIAILPRSIHHDLHGHFACPLTDELTERED